MENVKRNVTIIISTISENKYDLLKIKDNKDKRALKHLPQPEKSQPEFWANAFLCYDGAGETEVIHEFLIGEACDDTS